MVLDQVERDAAKMCTAVRATAQRSNDHDGRFREAKKEAPANPPSMHRSRKFNSRHDGKMTKSFA